MGGHYDAPQMDSWHPDLLVRSPNLGIPCFVRQDNNIIFKVLFSGTKDDLDVKSLLEGKIFLQSLNDTRQILQDKTVQGIGDLNDVPRCLSKRLIPLEIEKVDAPIKSSWSWYKHGPQPNILDFPYAYWVSLRAKPKQSLDKCFNLPQLFNIIQNFPEVNWYNINFHSVYIHKKDWHNFTFIHATDTHVSWRNDTIPQLFEEKFWQKFRENGDVTHLDKITEFKERYINFNENFRDFIRYANILHRTGKIDFIILTADIVDFVHENFEQLYGRPRSSQNDLGKTPNYPRPIDNFEFFLELVTAWGSKEGIIIGEELEVPIFTLLGNHDYRANEYPLIHKLVYENINAFGKDVSPQRKEPIKEYSTFALTEDEALEFEGGLQRFHRDIASSFVDYYEDTPPSYKALINPDRDYVIDLGKHRMICLDSSHDEGVPKTILEYLLRGKSGKNFVAGSPDSAGFCQEQIDFLGKAMQDTKGLVIIATHAPLVNLHATPHHLIRETEQNRNFTDLEKEELLAFILANHPEATEIEDFMDNYGALAIGGPPAHLIKEAIDFFNKIFGKSPMEKMKEDGWVFGNSNLFKVGDRDPNLGWGVIAHKFKEFMQTIDKRINQDETAILVLTGHTHRNIEYVLTYRGATEESKLLRYYHDYYIDNTIHGQRPQDYWCSEKLPDYDIKYQPPKGVVWHHRSPLFVQTLSLGPRPSSQKPQINKAKPIGYTNAHSGKFSLFDLKIGSYELVFESPDKKRAIIGIHISEENAKGQKIEEHLLQPKLKESQREYEKAALKTGIPNRDLGKGKTLVAKGTIKESIRGRLIGGKITIYRVPPANGGALVITIKDDLIQNKKRIYLDEMRTNKSVPKQNQTFFILSNSPS